MNAASMNNLWSYIQGLPLTTGNRRWLAECLVNTPSTINSIETETPSDSMESISDDAPYTMEELNSRIDEAGVEIDSGQGKSFEEMMSGFKKELSWLN